MSDVSFEKLLDEYNQEYVESEAFTRWMPPDGEYLIVLAAPREGATPQDDGKDLLWLRQTGRIVEEGTYKDREFMIGYYTNKAFGILKAATEALSPDGKPAKNLREARQVLQDATGAIIRVSVETVYDKKRKRNFTNTTIEEVLEAEPTTTSDEAVEGEGEAPVGKPG